MLTLVVQFKIFYVLVHTVIFAFHLLAELGYFDIEVLIKNFDLNVYYTSNVYYKDCVTRFFCFTVLFL